MAGYTEDHLKPDGWYLRVTFEDGTCEYLGPASSRAVLRKAMPKVREMVAKSKNPALFNSIFTPGYIKYNTFTVNR